MATQLTTAASEQRGTQAQSASEAGSQQNRGMTRRSEPFEFSLIPSQMFASPFLISPFTLLRRMTEEIDRAFGEPGARGGRTESVWAPAIEVTQQEGKYIVRAELPGLSPEEVKIEVTDDALILEGERKFEQEENKSGVRRTERMYGRFYRVIPLPEGANTAEARARFQDGVLEITVPVTERQNNRRQLTIESGSNEKSGREQS